MEERTIEATQDDLHMHSYALSGDKEVYMALDKLPMGISDPFTGKTYHYETMIFSGNSEKNEVDWGNELLQERYETGKEAVTRAKEIAQSLMKGYTVEEIPPRGMHVEVVDEPQKVNGISIEKDDSLLKDQEGNVYTIAKTGQHPKDSKDLTVYSRFSTEDPFLPSPSDHPVNEIIPASAFLKSAQLHKQEKEIQKEADKVGEKKEDYVALPKRLAFTKSIEGSTKVIVDSYEPTSLTGGVSTKGVYHKQEETYEKGNLVAKEDKGYGTLNWEELKSKAQNEFKMIEQAKSQKFLYLPGNTTIMMPRDISREERNPKNHTAPERSSFRKKGIHRKPADQKLER